MKKITKFLDSVMGGIKRTCIAKALAVFAVASIAISSFAQTKETTQSPVINGVENFEGLTYEEVRTAAVAENTFPTDDKSKMLFFYNVKTGKFINVGGYWGTCVSLHDYGRAMWVNLSGSALHFAMDMNTSVGKYMGYVHSGSTPKDNGVFVDRQANDKIASSTWFIVPVEGDEKNTFKIYTEVYSNGSYEKMYLSANPDYNGTNLNCTVYKNPTEGCDTWRIFTYAQIYEKQKDGIVDHMKNALELSFRLKCPGFERGDNDIKNWKTYNFKDKVQNETGFAKFGLEKLYNTTASWGETEETYDVNDLSSGYTFEKDTYNEWENYRRNLGKYYCSSIKGKCGMIYQDVSITLPGTYVVECKGYSNTPKAKLFAGVLNPATNDNTMVHGTMDSTMVNQVSNMSAAEQEKLHTAECNMDYAGKEFYDNSKYVNSVVLTVPESAFYNKDGVRLKSVNIRLGVMTGEYNKDATKVEDAAPGEWTVFDDFRLQYASKNIAQDLVLDEMRDNLNYLYDTTNKYENTTLHLNKTLTPNKWNSLVLPVSLTKEQLQSTFGANVRLAKLQTLTSTAIEFESVDLNKEALQAYIPYIIFPERTSNASDAYTASLTVSGKTETVVVPAGHYTIAKVTMGDLSQIKKADWTTMLHGGDGTIKAYGTFARTFDPNATQNEDATQNEKYGTWNFSNNKGTIINGRPTLIGSYFFDKGNMYHSTKRPRGLRGFSCWFQPTTTSGAQNAQLTIDGVSQGTTGIEDILADYEQPVSRFANGVYNLNGQLVKQGNSTAGLPSGMYIVNGKKCIVR